MNSPETPHSPDPAPAIEAHHLQKRFKDFTALYDLSFQVYPGEIVGLLGPNGAGKTTSLRILAGLLSPTSGSASICGHDLARNPQAARAELGFTSGGTGLYQRLTALELLQTFAALYGLETFEANAAIEDCAGRFDLNDFLSKRVQTLSSGQKQRLNLARCFLHHPKALILDEPTAALDVIASHGLHQQIRRAKSEGCAVLFSTHILSEAETLCDRLVLLLGGRVLDEGTPADLCQRHHVPHLTALFLQAAQLLTEHPEPEP